MAIIFSAIILYRREVLAQHGIIVEDYFLRVIKAFVIAKVVMIGTFLAFMELIRVFGKESISKLILK